MSLRRSFTMLLVMALVTTVMTTPLLMLFSRNTESVEERQPAA